MEGAREGCAREGRARGGCARRHTCSSSTSSSGSGSGGGGGGAAALALALVPLAALCFFAGGECLATSCEAMARLVVLVEGMWFVCAHSRCTRAGTVSMRVHDALPDKKKVVVNGQGDARPERGRVADDQAPPAGAAWRMPTAGRQAWPPPRTPPAWEAGRRQTWMWFNCSSGASTWIMGT